MDNNSGKILIADDEPDNIRILAKALSGNYKIIGATSGEEALECAIARETPDLILLDIMMPDMDGYAVLERLKADESTRHIPVIFITALNKEVDEIRGFDLGAVDYVTKPFSSAVLNARVRTHLALRDSVRALETANIRLHREIAERQKAQEDLQESERRYRAVVQDQTELICRFRADGTLVFVNDAYCRYFGRNRKELLGRSFMMFMSPDDRKKTESHLSSLSKGNPVASIEHQVLNAHADLRWLRRTDRAILDERDEVSEIQSVARDVTERKLAEDSLKDAMTEKEVARARLEAVFRSVPEGIVTVDNRGQIIQINDPLKNICPLAPRMMSEPSLAHLTETCHCVSALRELLDTGRAASEHRIQCRNGDSGSKNLNLTTLPLLDHKKRTMGAMLVIRDVTRLVELETRLGERRSFGSIVGQSEAMQRIYTLLEQFADTEVSVMITGETGTGKERIMEALHFGSSRSEKPLVRVNCAMLAENLIESELFGHVRGAFTGADRDKVGRFEMARGGTLFLDEIGEIAPHLQAKLLRVLEYKEFERVGESKSQKADVRVIAATNVNLAEQVRQGSFREDLFYRLKVFSIHLPPLRERIGDIPLLARHFMELGAKSMGKQFDSISDDVLGVFAHYPWPGNVRELKNAIEYACVLCPGGVIRIEHLPPEMLAPPDKNFLNRNGVSLPMSEKEAVLDALNRAKWNKSKAARLLGVSRGTFYNRLHKYGIET